MDNSRDVVLSVGLRSHPAEPVSVNRRLYALASFYRYAVRQRAITESPFFDVARPNVSGDSLTSRLDRDELRRLRRLPPFDAGEPSRATACDAAILSSHIRRGRRAATLSRGSRTEDPSSDEPPHV